MLKDGLSEEINHLKTVYPDNKSALLPALKFAQSEYGWLSNEALESVALKLNMSKSFVKGVASFYSMFRNQPLGRHLIMVCTNVTCMLFGSDSVLEAIRDKYSLEPGGTTDDGRFSLLEFECIGNCDAPPSMLVNEDVHSGLTMENVIEILERYK